MNKNFARTIIIRFFTITTVTFLFVINYAFSGMGTNLYPLYPPSARVKNIVFLIGDGMGLAQVAAARISIYGADGRLNMERMPVTGLITSHSADRLITCSAAAATALATGYKTNNGMVSINPDGRRLLTILEACRDKGMATGIAVTSPITNATPAAFAAHVKSRSDETSIASQLLENKVNVLLGGGKNIFIPRSEDGSERHDDLDLIAKAKNTGYSFVQTKEEMAAAANNYVLGLFQLEALTTNLPEPSLAEMTKKAIDLLNRNKKGFFLMAEGSQIDWACHHNNPEEAIRQIRLFDEAVKTALEFALKDRHTLVVVAADHETGGMAIDAESLDGRKMEIKWMTEKHTGIPLVVYAFGPQAEQFTGLHDNTEVPRIFARLLGIKSFPMINK